MGRRSKGFQLKEYGGIWYVLWSEGRRSRRVSTRQTTRTEAEKFRAALVSEFGKAQRTGQTLTVSDALDYYVDEHCMHIVSGGTAKYHVPVLRAHFGYVPVSEVTPSLVREFTTKQTDAGYSNGYIKRQLTTLIAAFNYCRKEGKIAAIPHIPVPKGAEPKDRWLSLEEADALLTVARDHIKVFIALGLYTGQRKGAILDLKWSQVNFENSRIDFNPIGRIQTNKRRAIVVMNDELRGYLEDAYVIAEKKGNEHVISCRGYERLGDIKKGFKAACVDARLANVTPHTLRHTCATWLAQSGVDMWKISGMLGHSHSRTTELYAKHSPDYMKGVVSELDIVRKLRTKQENERKNATKSGKAR